MKIIKNAELESIISKKALNCTLSGIYPIWKKLKTLVLFMFAVVAYFLAMSTLNAYENEILGFFDVDQLELHHKLVFALIAVLAILVLNIPIIIVHEFLHWVSLPSDENKYIVLNLPVTVSVFYDDWLTKKQMMKTQITPVIVITVFLSLLAFIFQSGYLIIFWLILINIGLASSDLFCFFYVAFKMPANVEFYGNYFRC